MPTASVKAHVGDQQYPVYISDHALEGLKAFLSAYKGSAVFVVYDACLPSLGSACCAELMSLIRQYASFEADGKIDSKTIDAAVQIAEAMFHAGIPRDGVLVAVGGGVVGDIAGFAASIFQRGIDLVHVPTTSTSMIDSAIGGKTGANLCGQVNLIGTYFQPRAVFMDIRFLETLEFRDLISGFAEALKMAFISDHEASLDMGERAEELLSLRTDRVFEVIRWAVGTKLSFVSSDVTERSLRLHLNYGHTFGQAFESFYGLSHRALRHGEAVALGMMCAARASVEMAIAGDELVAEHQRLIARFSLPTHISDLDIKSRPTVEYLEGAMYNDKKRTSTGTRLILCENIGAARVAFVEEKQVVREAFSSVMI